MIKQHCKFNKKGEMVEYSEINSLGEIIIHETYTYYPTGEKNSIIHKNGLVCKLSKKGEIKSAMRNVNHMAFKCVIPEHAIEYTEDIIDMFNQSVDDYSKTTGEIKKEFKVTVK